MIKHPYIYDGKRLFEGLRERLVGMARFRYARKVIVAEDYGASIVIERALYSSRGYLSPPQQSRPSTHADPADHYFCERPSVPRSGMPVLNTKAQGFRNSVFANVRDLVSFVIRMPKECKITSVA